jgi:hypothetical protein
MAKFVAALFIDERGPYPFRQDVLCWGPSSDARKYAEDLPVIAHPPCARWSSLARVNQKRWGTPIGEDGGCFASALESLERCGGVLEHPANSIAFATFGIPKPKGREWVYIGEGKYVGEVWQSDYGHLATKRTWLLYKGRTHPIQFCSDRKVGEFSIGGGVRTGHKKRKRMPSKLNHISPDAFVDYLVTLAKMSDNDNLDDVL